MSELHLQKIKEKNESLVLKKFNEILKEELGIIQSELTKYKKALEISRAMTKIAGDDHQIAFSEKQIKEILEEE